MTIYIAGKSSHWIFYTTGVTDSSGAISLPSLPRTEDVSIYGVNTNRGYTQLSDEDVASGFTDEGLALRLHTQPPLKGVVKDKEGNPIENVEVKQTVTFPIEPPKMGKENKTPVIFTVQRLKTAKEGTLRVLAGNPDSMRIFLGKDGYRKENYLASDTPKSSNVYQFEIHEAYKPIELKVNDGLTKKPVVGAIVVVSRQGTKCEPVKTDESGKVVLKRVSPDKCTIRITAQGRLGCVKKPVVEIRFSQPGIPHFANCSSQDNPGE